MIANQIVNLVEACPGESYLLRIYGKPLALYRFYLSSGAHVDSDDETGAMALAAQGFLSEPLVVFYAIDAYDDEPHLYVAPHDLRCILRNVLRSGATFCDVSGDEILLSIRGMSPRYIVVVKGKYKIECPEEHNKQRVDMLTTFHTSSIDCVKLNLPHIISPPKALVAPEFSLASKEYLINDEQIDKVDFLSAFVAEVARSGQGELADTASRIIVEMRNDPRRSLNNGLRSIYNSTK